MNKTIARFVVIGLALLMFILTVKFALGLNDAVMINGTMAPYNVSVSLAVYSSASSTVYSRLISNNSELNYYFANETYYNISEEKLLNFSMSRNAELNISRNISVVWNISNDANNNSFLYYVLVQIVVPEYVTPISSSFITIQSGDYVINITSDLLPMQNRLTYQVAGVSGTVLNISCNDSWLSCPSYSIFASNNLTFFDINYTINENISIGAYTKNITFISGNVTKVTGIVFNILDPIYNFKSYVFSPDCFINNPDGTVSVTLECVQEKEEYDIKRLSQYLERLRQAPKNNTCNPITVPQYIVAGNISESMWEDYSRCRDDRREFLSQVSDLGNKLSTCQSETSTWQMQYNDTYTKMMSNESTCLSNVFETSIKLKKDAEDYRASVIKMIWKVIFWSISCIVILLLIGYAIYINNKEAWSKW